MLQTKSHDTVVSVMLRALTTLSCLSCCRLKGAAHTVLQPSSLTLVMWSQDTSSHTDVAPSSSSQNRNSKWLTHGGWLPTALWSECLYPKFLPHKPTCSSMSEFKGQFSSLSLSLFTVCFEWQFSLEDTVSSVKVPRAGQDDKAERNTSQNSHQNRWLVCVGRARLASLFITCTASSNPVLWDLDIFCGEAEQDLCHNAMLLLLVVAFVLRDYQELFWGQYQYRAPSGDWKATLGWSVSLLINNWLFWRPLLLPIPSNCVDVTLDVSPFNLCV